MSEISMAVVFPGMSGLSLGAKFDLNFMQMSHGCTMNTELCCPSCLL